MSTLCRLSCLLCPLEGDVDKSDELCWEGHALYDIFSVVSTLPSLFPPPRLQPQSHLVPSTAWTSICRPQEGQQRGEQRRRVGGLVWRWNIYRVCRLTWHMYSSRVCVCRKVYFLPFIVSFSHFIHRLHLCLCPEDLEIWRYINNNILGMYCALDQQNVQQ